MLPKQPPQRRITERIRKRSLVNPFNGIRLIPDFQVWSHHAPSVKEKPDTVFAKLVVVPGSTPTRFKVKQIDPPGRESEVFEIEPGDCFQANDEKDYDGLHDIIGLKHGSPAAVLHFLETRYKAGSIYTNAGPLLIAVNPVKKPPLHGHDQIAIYRNDETPSYGLPPHIYKTAREALESCLNARVSQSIILAGESGSGKTEAAREILNFLTAEQTGVVVRHPTPRDVLMAGNLILEAFGNASTVRNANATRAGRYTKLWLSRREGLISAQISAFFFYDKSRVLDQSFHIFKKLPSSEGGGLSVLEAMGVIGLDQAQIDRVFGILTGISILANLESETESTVSSDADSEQMLAKAAGLLGLPCEQLEKEISSRVTGAGVAVCLYESLYQWLVNTINKRLASNAKQPASPGPFVGVLDAPGFEILETNSLEQLLINTTHETLQQHFVQTAFAGAERLCREEGLGSYHLAYTDNGEILEDLWGASSSYNNGTNTGQTGKASSVFACLEEQQDGRDEQGAAKGEAAQSSEEASQLLGRIQTQVIDKQGEVVKIVKATDADGNISSETKKDSGSENYDGFVVAHSLGDVTYNAKELVSKNRTWSCMKPELVTLMKESSNPVIAELAIKRTTAGSMTSQLKTQLTGLIGKTLASTECHFIRCINPQVANANQSCWNRAKVLNQLFALSIIEALQLKQFAFPCKRPLEAFVKQYEYVATAAGAAAGLDKTGDNTKPMRQGGRARVKDLASSIMKECKIPDDDYKIGISKVFLTHAALGKLDAAYKEHLRKHENSVSIIQAAFRRYRYDQIMQERLPYLIRFQARARLFLQGCKVAA